MSSTYAGGCDCGAPGRSGELDRNDRRCTDIATPECRRVSLTREQIDEGRAENGLDPVIELLEDVVGDHLVTLHNVPVLLDPGGRLRVGDACVVVIHGHHVLGKGTFEPCEIAPPTRR